MPSNRELEEERRLIEKAKKNPERFLVLYDKYFDQIYRYIFRRTGGDKDVTHDIASQTFLDALSHLKKFTWQGFPFSSWLYKIAHNNVIKWYRKSGRNKYMPIEEARKLSDENQDQKALTENNIAQNQINEMMSHLEEDEREILRLKYYEGVSNVEIAEIMGLSVTNVGVKVFRTLKKAKGLLPTKNDLKTFDQNE